MNILLIYPPQVRAFMPHLALPLVKQELTRRGHHCKIIDLNLKFYLHVLNRSTLEKAQLKLREEIDLYKQKNEFTNGELVLFARKSSALIRSQYIIDNIELALKIFNGEQFYDFGKYKFALKILEESLELFSSNYGFTDIGISRFRMKYGVSRSAEILEACEDKAENPFLDMFPAWIDEEINSFKPDAIAITFSMDEQLIPGFTLANYLRKTWNGLMVAGGGMVTRLKHELPNHPVFSKIFDSYFPFANAAKFCDMLDALANKPFTMPDKFSDLCPDFSDLPLDDYLAPERLLPFELTIGCSYAKCFYCNHYKTYGDYRYGDATAAANHLKVISEKYGSRHFYFVDEDLVPKFGEELATALKEMKVDINWMIFGRLHKAWKQETFEKLSAGGCKRLIWGLDSVTDRIQAAMNKFTDLDYAEDLLKWSSINGITNSLNFIVGYPSETREEALTIVDFLKRNKPSMGNVGSAIAVSNFMLVKDAAWDKMELKPRIKEEEDFAIYYEFDVERGLTMDETPAFAQEIQDIGVDHLSVGKFNPALRELALLYCSRYGSADDIPITEITGDTSGVEMQFFPVNLESIYGEIQQKMAELSFTSEQFKSNWWRVVTEKEPTTVPIGNIYGYTLNFSYNEVCFQLPISLDLVIEQ
ncbi:B12-binding domain-containing radical SAM protein [Chitinophaga flava]|nr:radical SAM protein [Chitinophaga flava]